MARSHKNEQKANGQLSEGLQNALLSMIPQGPNNPTGLPQDVLNRLASDEADILAAKAKAEAKAKAQSEEERIAQLLAAGKAEEQAKLDAMMAEIARLKGENAALKNKPVGRLSIKRSEKGAVSVYGMGRFPVTLYREQWERLFAAAEEIKQFIADNDSTLKRKGDE